LANPTFWFTLLLICVILILPTLGREWVYFSVDMKLIETEWL
jgi:hypothetical protein